MLLLLQIGVFIKMHPFKKFSSVLARRKFISQVVMWDKQINRREAISTGLLLLGGLAFAGLVPGCSALNSYQAKNYSGPGNVCHSFDWNLNNRYMPGVGFCVYGNTPIVACADGKILGIHKVHDVLKQFGLDSIGRHLGGLEIMVAHDDDYTGLDGFHFKGAYATQYTHLRKSNVKMGVYVKRGDVIGYGGLGDATTFKLMMRENGNLVNPLNYGPDYGPLSHFDPSHNYDNTNTNIREKYEIQKDAVMFIDKKYQGKSVMTKTHAKGYFGICRWSWLDMMRYYEKKFEKNPKRFNLSETEFNKHRDRFYGNQPFSITFPTIGS